MKLKNTPLLILASVTFFALACKKDNNSANPELIGKWQQTKLRTYMLDSAGVTGYDTTYISPFTKADYVQFNLDGTCYLSIDHYYYINSPGEPKNPQKIDPIVSNLKYSATGNNKYLISPQKISINPGGFDIRDTVSLIDSKTLLYRSVFYEHGGYAKGIVDSYYTK